MAPPVPPKEPFSSPSLGIRLADALQKTTVAPGDTLTGCVYRSEPAVGTHSRLTLSLIGRLWNETEREVPDHTSPYRETRTVTVRSELELFWKSQSLYQGPLHIAPGSNEQTWPFSVTFPEEPERRFAPRGSGMGFTPPKAYIHNKQSFPPSFNHDDLISKRSRLGMLLSEPVSVVEYYLEAKLMIQAHGKLVDVESLLVLPVAPFWHEPMLSRYRLKSTEFERSVASKRLLPGMRDARPSLSDRARRLFRSSKDPSFAMKIEVQTPKVVQLENPNPIPFVAHLTALPGKGAQALRDVSQTVELTRLGIEIVCITKVRPEDRLKDDTMQESRSAVFPLQAGHMLAVLGPARTMVLSPGGRGVKLDIGTLCRLKMGHFLWKQKVSDEATTPSYCKIQPSFTTYYIQHSHVIRWELGFDIVGEEAKVYGADEIVVLPPSDYRVPPKEPTAVEAAPPFEDGCASDRKLDRPKAPLDSSEE
ncbi:uncharacterized protein E0L32_001123 [Thyridium curvatum]|uniref:Arrestin-like N-terminal domain-containing protein n=1 Tax=Thyridium curvatum TaxID=1093900 RepID=A0A507AL50_9PEZI|nr:uncharacterized protein E0L32_001123 [Thyridium curvatum]TPX11305.1 hypothetical protein E0L32_001123 [Thyridium curvatum]